MTSTAFATRVGFTVRVITPEKIAYEHEAEHVQSPGLDGLYGILKNHAAMITGVGAGIMTVREVGGAIVHLFVADGFAEVKDNLLRLVCDSSEMPDEVDIERARESEERARARIAERHTIELDLPRAEAALQRALFRQQLVKKYRAG